MDVEKIRELIQKIDANIETLDLDKMTLKDKLLLKQELTNEYRAKSPLTFTNELP